MRTKCFQYLNKKIQFKPYNDLIIPKNTIYNCVSAKTETKSSFTLTHIITFGTKSGLSLSHYLTQKFRCD
jgi:hypothetical protein